MDVGDALARRRSCRDYTDRPVAPEVLDRVLAAFGRGPTAGNTWGLDLVVLDDRASVDRYWATTLPADRREAFPWPGLLRAPVLALAVADPGAYVDRYTEPDKAATGLGAGEERWPVPYWWVDAGAAVMALLVAATAEGLGSLLFGVFDHEAAVRSEFGVPGDRRLVGAVAIGHPAPAGRASVSARRGRPGPEAFVHRRHW